MTNRALKVFFFCSALLGLSRVAAEALLVDGLVSEPSVVRSSSQSVQEEAGMSIEIELRFRVTDEAVIRDFIKPLKFLEKKRVYDVYFDTPNADLIKRGIYVRLRDGKKIDVKFNRACLLDASLELQAYCEEHSFMLPLKGEEIMRFNNLNEELDLWPAFGGDITSYKAVNNFIEHRVVDKMRSSYEWQDMIILVDEIKDLGMFLEIELVTQDKGRIEDTAARMRTFLKGLPLEPLKTGYDSLVLRKQNFEQYLRGRFVLEEDKKFLQKGV
jgi:adenylate cyclase class IV